MLVAYGTQSLITFSQRGSALSTSAWRPWDKTQKAEDGWLQLRVLTRTTQSHGDCGTVQRTQQQSGSSVRYVQYVLQGIAPKKKKNPVSGIQITFIAHSCSVLKRPFNFFFFLLLGPPTNTQSQELDEVSQSDWSQVRCAHSLYSWDLKHKEIILILGLWLGNLEIQIVAPLSQIHSRTNREGRVMTS